MSKTYRIYQVDAFTRERFSGNPAGVVSNADGLSADEMQKIARELNNSETAFLFTEGCEDCDVRVRFFTPSTEVPICGHATISAHYVYALERQLSGHTKVLQKTGAGILPVDIYEENGDYQIVMTQGKVSVSEPLSKEVKGRILDALGLAETQLLAGLPMAVASTGHSKVMVGIQDIKKLHQLAPDLAALSAISAEIGCNGYYVFTLCPQRDEPLVHGRMFAPAIGISEDPVTGNANGPLGAYLVHMGYADNTKGQFSFEAIQGEAIHRPGRIRVTVDICEKKPVLVRVQGHAVIAFQTQITL